MNNDFALEHEEDHSFTYHHSSGSSTPGLIRYSSGDMFAQLRKQNVRTIVDWKQAPVRPGVSFLRVGPLD
jgi:hypothetical protein